MKNTGTEFVVYCKAGIRSKLVAEFMKQSGYQRVWNLSGGILAWKDEGVKHNSAESV